MRITLFVLNRVALVIAGVLAAAHLAAAHGAALEFDGWSPKFYPGLEADGKVSFDPTGFRGGMPSITLTWTSGMPKFGVAKQVESKLKGVVDWTVSAYIKCEEKGRVAVAMEFFDKRGVSLGIVNGTSRTFAEWTRITWKFSSPRLASKGEVHLLSLAEAPASFACVEVVSCQGIDKNDVPFDMKILPAEWNRDWNGGRTRMMNFSDAPLPMTVLLKGEKKALESPLFEIDLPDELEIKDAFCPFAAAYGHEIPTRATSFVTNGVRMTCFRFETLRYFSHLTRKFNTDGGSGIALVIGPKTGGERIEKEFLITCRIADGERLAAEREVKMSFRPLPEGLKTAKNFIAMGWNSIDRRMSDDKVLKTAFRAYEAAGLRMFRLSKNDTNSLQRVSEIRAILEHRPVSHVFAVGLGDMWMPSKANITKRELANMGGRLSVTSDTQGRHAKKICPTFFTTSETFHRHLAEKAIWPILETVAVKDGDWVTLDMEPWQSGTYCYCDECLNAFATFAKLDRVPTMAEALTMKDEWAEFRVRHSAKTVEIVSGIIRKYNPSLKILDYDYIMEYGNPSNRAAFIRGCAKDTLMNEQWLDGHLCSYYHRIGRPAFDAMKNNVRNLNKPYYPMAGLSGYASWVRPGEVLNPRQIRQFALAAFVNGCPGYAFYSGNCFDGEVLLAMMEVQDVAARYEDLPWGKVDGKAEPKCASEQFVYASTTRPDGTEVVALFNYDGTGTIEVAIGGEKHSVAPLDVKFIEIGK